MQIRFIGYSHRIPFIRDGLISSDKAQRKKALTPRPLENIEILEVGCGAGILTEALARLHATVQAIDPGKDLIDAATDHLKTYENVDDALVKRITYRNESLEQHLAERPNVQYDAVVVSEVLEHVTEKHAFLELCVAALKVRPSHETISTVHTQINCIFRESPR